MKRRWLIVLGIAAFLLLAIVTFPARVLLGFLAGAGIQAEGVQGTVWKGRAQVVRLQDAALGAVEWDLHALALLALQVRADVRVARPDGFAQSRVSLRSKRRIVFDDLSASLPVQAFAVDAARGWTGTANLRFEHLVLTEGWPREAQGTADLLNLNNGNVRAPLSGSYKLTFPAPDAAQAADALVGSVADLDGPLQVAGTLELRPERGYLLRGFVTPRPNAPKSLVNQLQILGAPDAQGRREFALEGQM
jgi:general secretion pathway protein N